MPSMKSWNGMALGVEEDGQWLAAGHERCCCDEEDNRGWWCLVMMEFSWGSADGGECPQSCAHADPPDPPFGYVEQVTEPDGWPLYDGDRGPAGDILTRITEPGWFVNLKEYPPDDPCEEVGIVQECQHLYHIAGPFETSEEAEAYCNAWEPEEEDI